MALIVPSGHGRVAGDAVARHAHKALALGRKLDALGGGELREVGLYDRIRAVGTAFVATPPRKSTRLPSNFGLMSLPP